MKILIVCSGTQGILSPFVKDQMDSLAKLGIELKLFQINKKGVVGYISHLRPLKKIIKKYNPDIVHAHYGLSGLLANLQRRVPVVTTFHGSDIHIPWVLFLSKIVMLLSKYNIFVSSKLALRAKTHKKYSIIPCGVNIDTFQVLDKIESKKKLGLLTEKNYVLFSSGFSNIIKNYPLAVKAIDLLLLQGFNIELIEFKGYDRKTSNTLMNAVDCVLVTSFSESGPLVIKEAMAVNNCAVSVDVGDVQEITKNLNGYFPTSFNPESVADGIKKAITFSQQNKKTDGRNRIIQLELDSASIAHKIINVYQKVKGKGTLLTY